MLGTNNKILWLASYPKSGNTWFRIILHNIIHKSMNPSNINDLGTIPIASSRYIFDRYSGVSSSDLTIEEINAIRPRVYRQMAEEAKKDLILKVHDAWSVTESGKEIFPNDVTKGVVYLVRNPLDISVSFAFHQGVNIKRAIDILGDENFKLLHNNTKLYAQLDQTLTSWSSHVKSWTTNPGLPSHIIRYEDLLENPYSTVLKALDFMRIPHSREDIVRAIQNSSFKELQKQERENGFNEKSMSSKEFFRSGRSGVWKNHLDNDDICRIISMHKEVMAQYGYL